MAEFCMKCCKEVMGINPDKHPEWLVRKGDLCEGCGYLYLQSSKKVNGGEVKIGDSRGNALKLGKELRRPIVMPKPKGDKNDI